MIEKAECTNCGAPLEVDAEKKVAICPYCNQPYIVEEAINNYTIHAENLYAGVVNMHDDRSSAARLKAGNEFLMVKEWEKADAAFQEVCDLTPGDYKGWWGRIRAKTHDFAVFQPRFDMASICADERRIGELKRLYKGVNAFAPADQKAAYKETFDNYLDQVENELISAKKANAQCRRRAANRIETEIARRKETEKTIMRLDRIYSSDEGMSFFEGLHIFGVLGIAAFVCIIWLLASWDFDIIPKIVLGAIIIITLLLIGERIRIKRAKEKADEFRRQLNNCDHSIIVLQTAKEAFESENQRMAYEVSRQELLQVLNDIEQEVRDKG